jgi:hypothetical protein
VEETNAIQVVTSYYKSLSSKAILEPSTISQLFISLNYSLPQNFGAILVGGDKMIIPFSGLWADQEEISEYYQAWSATVVENTPLDTDANGYFVANGGSVIVKWNLQGHSVQFPGRSYSVLATDYFQLVNLNSAAGPQIARLTRFFDTWALSVAITDNNPFKQFK